VDEHGLNDSRTGQKTRNFHTRLLKSCSVTSRLHLIFKTIGWLKCDDHVGLKKVF
jgi:hypothetical protein